MNFTGTQMVSDTPIVFLVVGRRVESELNFRFIPFKQRQRSPNIENSSIT